MTTTTIRPTIIVRNIMHKYGKSAMWTNKHVRSRTIKCYTGNSVQDARMVNDIARALGEAGVKDTAVRYTKGSHWRGYGAIIIQVPM